MDESKNNILKIEHMGKDCTDILKHCIMYVCVYICICLPSLKLLKFTILLSKLKYNNWKNIILKEIHE